jgi:tetratricopeptide (TPR) repeat protein
MFSNRNLMIFLVDASSEERIKADYQAIIRSRSIAHRLSNYENALQWLASTDNPWLIIADGADDVSLDLHSFVPKCSHGHFIVTSRNSNRALMAHAHAHRVEELLIDDAVRLLLDVSGYNSTETNVEHATNIVTVLGNLPLAIAQAAGYIYIHKCLSTYSEIYNERRNEILSHRAKELPHGYELSVATTLEMSFNKLPDRSKDALCVFSFLQHASIAHEIIATAGRNRFFYASGKASKADDDNLDEIQRESNSLSRIFCPNERWSDHELYTIIEPCFQYSLLHSTVSRDEQKFYSMHILVQSWLQLRFAREGQPSFLSLAKRMLLSVARDSSRYQYFNVHQMLLPHLKPFFGTPTRIATDDMLLFHVLSDTGDAFTASIHLTSYMELAKNRIKEDTHERLKGLCELTWSLYALGKYQDAIENGRHTLDRCERTLGEEDPLTLTSMIQLATIYRDLMQLSESIELGSKVLVLRERLLGQEHPDTLSAMSDLGVGYALLKKNTEAQELNEKALELHRKVFGPEHPNTLSCMHRLAIYYGNSEQDEESRKLYEQIITISKKVLGPEHPQTLKSMVNLGRACRSLSDYEKARSLDEHSLTLYRRILGPEHPNTLKCMHNLALDRYHLGQYHDSKDLNAEVLQLRKKVLGSKNEETIWTMCNLARDYRRLGQHQDAKNLNEQASELYKEQLGEEHPDTIEAMDNLAIDFTNLQQYERAKELDEKILELRKKVLGLEHQDTLTSMGNLAIDYRDLKEHERAQRLDEDTLTIRQRVLGVEHLDTLASMENLAQDYHDLGQRARGRELQEQLLSLRKKVLGPDHPDTIALANELSSQNNSPIEVAQQIF